MKGNEASTHRLRDAQASSAPLRAGRRTSPARRCRHSRSPSSPPASRSTPRRRASGIARKELGRLRGTAGLAVSVKQMSSQIACCCARSSSREGLFETASATRLRARPGLEDDRPIGLLLGVGSRDPLVEHLRRRPPRWRRGRGRPSGMITSASAVAVCLLGVGERQRPEIARLVGLEQVRIAAVSVWPARMDVIAARLANALRGEWAAPTRRQPPSPIASPARRDIVRGADAR